MILKSLRALSDPTRLRIVALLEKDELSVNELQEVTRMGQSRISTHLGLLQDSGLGTVSPGWQADLLQTQSARQRHGRGVHPACDSWRSGIARARR